jgi:hypothetical protein
MRLNARTLIAAACLLSVCCAARAETNASVTVWFEGTYDVHADGSRTQKFAIIPWTNGLTIIRAVVAAGGYSTPPHRQIYLIRDGRSALLSDPRLAVRGGDALKLQAGDRIEFRGAQNNGAHGSLAPRRVAAP